MGKVGRWWHALNPLRTHIRAKHSLAAIDSLQQQETLNRLEYNTSTLVFLTIIIEFCRAFLNKGLMDKISPTEELSDKA